MTYFSSCYRSVPVVLIVIGGFLFSSATAVAQAKCTTTLDCAQRAVEAAAQASAAATVMQGRIDKLEDKIAKLSTKFEFVVRRGFQANSTTPVRIGCDEANGESLVAGSCIGSLGPIGEGGGQVGVGPFLFGSGSWDINNPLHTVECRSSGQSTTALAVCMRPAK